MQNVCMLATDHNVCKAYLSKLQATRNLPELVVFVKFRRQSRRRFPLGIMKPSMRRVKQLGVKWLFKRRMQATQREHLRFMASVEAICRQRNFTLPDYEKTVPEIISSCGVTSYYLQASSINAASLVDFLSQNVPQHYMIFCGGGILRGPMFSLGKKFIHVHPGIVPEIKGSDGILWSSLVRKKIGLSAFFMNQGIDTGDVVHQQEYEIPVLPSYQNPSKLKLANWIVDYIDPIYRAQVLGDLFLKEPDPGKWTSERQVADEGKVYYFMHSELKKLAVSTWMHAG